MDLPTPDPARVPDDDLENQITELAARIHAATFRLLMLIREFDRREAWAAPGLRSCAHWLNWKCGIDLGAAREKVRVARALGDLPKISAAFSRGELSYSKVRAMTRIATPENEDYLLGIARCGTASHVERLVRCYRSVKDAEELEAANERHERRALTWYYADDGAVIIHGRLDPEEGARVIKAIDSAVFGNAQECRSANDVSAKTTDRELPSSEPVSARRADALVLMADTVIAGNVVSPPPGERFEVSVHVDAAVLSGAESGGRCECDDGAALVPETARRLACDASMVQVTEKSNGDPLDVGRRTRTIPSALRRALKIRDRGCRFPGCTASRFVEGHHVRHWAKGGQTKLANLIQLCRYHHRLVHEGGFGVETDGSGEFRFSPPGGRVIRRTETFPRKRFEDFSTTECRVPLPGSHMEPDTCIPLWEGEVMDYEMAVEGLLAADGYTGPALKRPVDSR